MTRPGSGPIKIEGVKTRALLVLLLLSRNTVVSVDRIADTLWEGSPPPSVGGTIHAYVSRLRRALAGPSDGPLVTRRPGYLLRVEPDECDIDRFEELIRRANGIAPDQTAKILREALALWRGPALAEFADLPFVAIEADRLAELRLVAIERRAEAELALNRHAELVAELERLVADNPLRESLTALLMTALYRAGRQSEALRAYQATYRRLAEEIGVVPGPPLRALESAILNHDPALDAPATATSSAASVEVAPTPTRLTLPAALMRMRDQAPLLGRDAELGALRQAWSRLGSVDCGLLVVAGEPGIGKSRLVAELAYDLHEQGAAVLWGRAVPRQLVPYQPLVEAISDHLTARGAVEATALAAAAGSGLGWLLPDLADAAPGPNEPAARRYLMFEAAAALLAELATRAGAVLVLDDLHLADPSTLSIVEHLVHRTRRGPAAVVVTLDDTLAGAGTGLGELLSELGRDGLVDRVELAGLPQSAVAALMTLAGDGTPAPDPQVRAMYQRTQGNPFFVTELIRDGRAHAVPARVRDVVAARLSRLDPELTQVLQAACLVGAEFEPEVLPNVLDCPAATVDAVLDRAVRARLVDEVAGQPRRLRFLHQIVYDAVGASVPDARVAELRQRLVDALAERVDRADHFSTLAHHYRRTAHEDARRSVEYARRAGDHAMARLGFSEAAIYFESALETLAAFVDGALGQSEQGDTRRQRCELLVQLGTARRALYQRLSTQEAFLTAAELAIDLGDPHLLVRAAWGLVNISEYSAGSAAMAELYRHGLASLGPEDSMPRMALTAGLARALSPRPGMAALGREAIEMARRLGDPEAVLFALGASALTTWAPDNLEERIAFSSEVIAAGHELGWVELAHEARGWRATCAQELGDQAAADADLAAVRRWAQTSRQPYFVGLTHMRDAARALYQGRYGEAEGLATLAMRGIDAGPDFQAGYAAQLFGLRRDTGRLDEVDEMLTGLVAASPQVPAWRAARAVADVELGRPDAARSIVDSLVADGLETIPRDWLWMAAMAHIADACTGLATLGVPRLEAAQQLYDLLMPYRERCVVLAHGVLCDGSVGRQLGGLAALLGHDDEAEAHFELAIRVNQSQGAAPWTARAQLGYADLLRRRGDTQRAESLREQAMATAAALGAAGIA